MPIEASYDRLSAAEFETRRHLGRQGHAEARRAPRRGAAPHDVHRRLRRPQGARPRGEVDELGGGQPRLAHADVRVRRPTSRSSASSRRPPTARSIFPESRDDGDRQDLVARARTTSASSASSSTRRSSGCAPAPTVASSRTAAGRASTTRAPSSRTSPPRSTPRAPRRATSASTPRYDPDFFPANQGFMFQGGGKFCSLSLLKNPAHEGQLSTSRSARSSTRSASTRPSARSAATTRSATSSSSTARSRATTPATPRPTTICSPRPAPRRRSTSTSASRAATTRRAATRSSRTSSSRRRSRATR